MEQKWWIFREDTGLEAQTTGKSEWGRPKAKGLRWADFAYEYQNY